MKRAEVDDVVQWDPQHSPWGPIFVVVTEVRNRDIVGYFLIPGRREDEETGRAPVHIDHGHYARIGRSVWSAPLVLRVSDTIKAPEGREAGEAFLLLTLRPMFERAVLSSQPLLVDLDGTQGYPASFLDAAFGGLAKHYGPDVLSKFLQIKSVTEPYLVQDIRQYMEEARN